MQGPGLNTAGCKSDGALGSGGKSSSEGGEKGIATYG